MWTCCARLGYHDARLCDVVADVIVRPPVRQFRQKPDLSPTESVAEPPVADTT